MIKMKEKNGDTNDDTEGKIPTLGGLSMQWIVKWLDLGQIIPKIPGKDFWKGLPSRPGNGGQQYDP